MLLIQHRSGTGREKSARRAFRVIRGAPVRKANREFPVRRVKKATKAKRESRGLKVKKATKAKGGARRTGNSRRNAGNHR